jgi:hypothetical protein
MSNMGRAVLWIQQNGLESHPDALKLYLEHLEKEKANARSRNIKTKEQQDAGDSA